MINLETLISLREVFYLIITFAGYDITRKWSDNIIIHKAKCFLDNEKQLQLEIKKLKEILEQDKQYIKWQKDHIQRVNNLIDILTTKEKLTSQEILERLKKFNPDIDKADNLRNYIPPKSN